MMLQCGASDSGTHALHVLPTQVDPEEYKEMQAQMKGGSSGGAASGGQKAIAGRSVDALTFTRAHTAPA
eukprot:1147428-Pelagomonas_calceolata.AAC.2